MKRKEIIKILTKYQTTNPEYVREMHNSMVIDPMDYHKIAEAILQALEEQPVKDEKCEHVTPICYNPDAFCYRSECDQADSCIHHSNRKDKK
ncbi:MAG: hypothetical protein H8E98_03075 [Bacteroidetes bacterium]|nr:hypothetical protein [Bacteroidota bacterium]